MYYPDGQEVRVGDVVKLENSDSGTVVCSMDSNEYSDEYPESQWAYLKTGVMIVFVKDGLMHYQDTDGLSLVSRKR